ncbi:hypothetical protein [Treponema porcinum]|uniref:hypothetical protein n=1 Tax=Treponema porcinum TaxID=261392 RepID=UPI00235638EF|nr:hypothetical protein [Treponema porcinum]MCI6481354.1 hypothetical protein [Treponema porcinum]
MKYLICSDIHGSESAARKILSFFQSMECDRLINLGDTLYHGPRNPLPEGHNPKGAADALNGIAGKIFSFFCKTVCLHLLGIKFFTVNDKTAFFEKRHSVIMFNGKSAFCNFIFITTAYFTAICKFFSVSFW